MYLVIKYELSLNNQIIIHSLILLLGISFTNFVPSPTVLTESIDVPPSNCAPDASFAYTRPPPSRRLAPLFFEFRDTNSNILNCRPSSDLNGWNSISMADDGHGALHSHLYNSQPILNLQITSYCLLTTILYNLVLCQVGILMKNKG